MYDYGNWLLGKKWNYTILNEMREWAYVYLRELNKETPTCRCNKKRFSIYIEGPTQRMFQRWLKDIFEIKTSKIDFVKFFRDTPIDVENIIAIGCADEKDKTFFCITHPQTYCIRLNPHYYGQSVTVTIASIEPYQEYEWTFEVTDVTKDDLKVLPISCEKFYFDDEDNSVCSKEFKGMIVKKDSSNQRKVILKVTRGNYSYEVEYSTIDGSLDIVLADKIESILLSEFNSCCDVREVYESIFDTTEQDGIDSSSVSSIKINAYLTDTLINSALYTNGLLESIKYVEYGNEFPGIWYLTRDGSWEYTTPKCTLYEYKDGKI